MTVAHGLSWRSFSLCVLGLLLCLMMGGCSPRESKSDNLLFGIKPISSTGLVRGATLTDEKVPDVGTSWNSNGTAVFSSLRAEVVYDLGSLYEIHSLALLGDNNDVYEVLGSQNGQDYESLWRAASLREPGLRWRTTNEISSTVRYVKLSPVSGDSSLSVAELVIYDEIDQELPPTLQRFKTHNTGLYYRSKLLNLTGIVLLSLLLIGPRTPWSLRALLAGLCLYGGWQLGVAFFEGYPLESLPVSLTRALVATMALGVVLREGWLSGKNWPLSKGFHLVLLLLLSAVSVGAFYNLGKPQFFDHKQKAPSVVHHYDMRVYFPAAKYFEELKYDGLYLASVASYAEEHGGLDTRVVEQTSLRDLRSHQMVQVPQVRQEIEEISARFSSARWQEFKVDMSYFWQTMGTNGYLGSLRDHGGNATPVWLALVYLMYGSAQASNVVLLLGGLLDPLLLLGFFVCAWRTFGARTACLALIVFGANEFYMFGSNWAGATLRNDWMVYLGLGVCALAKDRYRLGGALLALSALIRAFPAFTLLALGLPVALWLVQQRRARGHWPSWKMFKKEQAWFLHTALGASIAVLVLGAASSMILGWDAWPLWLQKISSFTASPHVNHLGLLSVVAGSQSNQAIVLAQRMPFYFIAQVLFFVLALWVSSTRRPHQVALLGLLLMPVFLYPANYYLHAVFLLVMLVDEPLKAKNKQARIQSARVWGLLLFICMAQYLTVREKSLEVHFYNASVILCAGLLAILYVLLPRDAQGAVALPFARSLK